MRQIAELSPEQIDQAWEFAIPIEGENPDLVRHDFAGARIHKDKYNVEEEYGWVVEYILNEKFLDKYSTTLADIFCEGNVRVLYYKNSIKNAYNSSSEIVSGYTDQNGHNVKQSLAPVLILSPEHLKVLKDIYGLSNKSINTL